MNCATVQMHWKWMNKDYFYIPFCNWKWKYILNTRKHINSKFWFLKNWESTNKVRVPNIQATNVLRCSNWPDLKANSESVRIFEISQQVPKLPTFFFFVKRKEKSRNFFKNRCFFQVSWFRCHIVRIQRDFQNLTLPNLT